jgi:hypothetical protein
LSSEDPTWWTIYAGDVDLEGNGEVYNLAKFIIHEDYDASDQYFDDIALVKVSNLIANKSFLYIKINLNINRHIILLRIFDHKLFMWHR